MPGVRFSAEQRAKAAGSPAREIVALVSWGARDLQAAAANSIAPVP